jgi:hypothetical protein
MRECGEFVVAYQEERPDPQNTLYSRQDVFVRPYDHLGAPLGDAALASRAV